MALALAAVSAARQNKEAGSSLPQALQTLQQTLEPTSQKSDSAEAIAGQHKSPCTAAGNIHCSGNAPTLLKPQDWAHYQALRCGRHSDRQSPGTTGVCSSHSLKAQALCMFAVAASQGAVKELLACCREASSQPSPPDLATRATQALTAVLASDSARDEFAEQDGSTALTALLEVSKGPHRSSSYLYCATSGLWTHCQYTMLKVLRGFCLCLADMFPGLTCGAEGKAGVPWRLCAFRMRGSTPSCSRLVKHHFSFLAFPGASLCSIAACIEAAAAKNETSKCAFVDKGAHVLLIDAVRQPGISHEALKPICGALRSFATADDLRPTTSRYGVPLHHGLETWVVRKIIFAFMSLQCRSAPDLHAPKIVGLLMQSLPERAGNCQSRRPRGHAGSRAGSHGQQHDWTSDTHSGLQCSAAHCRERQHLHGVCRRGWRDSHNAGKECIKARTVVAFTFPLLTNEACA